MVSGLAGLMMCEEQKTLRPVEVGRSVRESVNALVVDRQGMVWAGYEHAGLLRLFCGKATWFSHTNGLPGDAVRALCLDASGVLWIGTTAGLVRWDNERRSLFTTAQGLADNTIQQIVDDDNGHLWLGSRHGLMRLSQSELAEAAEGRVGPLRVRVFDRISGLPAEECSSAAGAKTRSGKLLFPTLDGLVMIDPDRLAADAAPLPVVIEEVWANGHCVSRPHPPVPVIGGRRFAPLDFKKETRDVTFRFTLPAVSGAERNRFKYRLDGHDQNWSAPTDRREAGYAQLSPGQYRFRVIACNRDGVWSATEDSVAFSISAPLWQQPFVIGGALLAVMVGFVTWRRHRAGLARR